MTLQVRSFRILVGSLQNVRSHLKAGIFEKFHFGHGFGIKIIIKHVSGCGHDVVVGLAGEMFSNT